MTDDAVQLEQFVENGNEEAFRGLVCRHFNLVYGTALRLTNRDASLAEDVAQTVFADLARKAGLLSRNIQLTGWLYQAARFAAAKAVRSERRRRAREQEAFAMHDPAPEPPPEWERLHSLLDAAIGKLNTKDRDAVLLHYFEQRSFRAVGAALGLSDDAAQKRVGRALDKLRTLLRRGGGATSVSSLSNYLQTVALPCPPAGLASLVAKASLADAAAMGPPGLGSVLSQVLAQAKARLAVCLLVLLLGGGAAHLVTGGHPGEKRTFVAVDLSAYCNGGLDKSWTPAYGNNDLAAIGKGRRVLKRVPFEVQGVIQLQGKEWKQRGYTYPESVEGIRVGTVGSCIHILHANSAIADPPGTSVASLVLHYSDGDETRFDIRQGVEVLDWWDWPRAPNKRPTGTNTVIAWKGSNLAAEHQGAGIRLFETVFVNPHPEKEIRSVDYTSAMAGSAPFMVALTIEL